MDTLSYTLDSMIDEFFSIAVPKEKRRLYIGIIKNIYLLNKLPNIYVEYDLNDLETKIIAVLQEEDVVENKIAVIHEYIKLAAIEYIESLGISLLDDRTNIYLYQLLSMLAGLYNIFNTNVTGAQFILDTLRNDTNEDDVNIAELLEEYSSVPAIEYFELIDDIDNTLIDTLTKYFTTILDNYDASLDDETNNGIKSLLEIDPTFNNTDVVKDMLRLGLKPNLFSNSLNNLYFNINKYEATPELIPYEIAGTLFLCDDSEQDMTTFLTEDINIELIEFIEKDEDLKNSIMNKTVELINKLQSKVVRR